MHGKHCIGYVAEFANLCIDVGIWSEVKTHVKWLFFNGLAKHYRMIYIAMKQR